MRVVFTLALMTLAINSFSQKNDSQILLTKGQKFTLRTTSTQNADLGMGMELKNNSSMTTSFIVINTGDNDYTISNTLTGVKMSMDFMGQQTNYDSDLKEDTASEIGKSIKNLNVPDTVMVNRYTGAVHAEEKKETAPSLDETKNPMESLMESLGDVNTDVAVTEAFFMIPAGKKAGDSWTDSSSSKQQKTVKTYTIKSIDKDIATITATGKTESNIQTEFQSLQVTVVMTTKLNSEIIVNTKTSLVSKRNTTSDIDGNLELMGQSQPITGKSTTLAVYEYN